MKSIVSVPLILAATMSLGIATAQTPRNPTSPSSPVAPASGFPRPTPGSPTVPVAPGTVPEQPAPAPLAPSPSDSAPVNQTTPTGTSAAQTSVPSGEVSKAQQTGQSAHGGKTTEDGPPPPNNGMSGSTTPGVTGKDGKVRHSKSRATRPSTTQPPAARP